MKFFGNIGFVVTEETSPGVYEVSDPVERPYYGDVNRHRVSWQSNSESINDNILVSNDFTIIADDYIVSNIGYMRYIVWNGCKWKITSFDLSFPRITIAIGGLWNG